MQRGNEEKVRINVKLPKALVDDFDTICTTKGYQKRDDAIHDLIAVHVEKENQIKHIYISIIIKNS